MLVVIYLPNIGPIYPELMDTHIENKSKCATRVALIDLCVCVFATLFYHHKQHNIQHPHINRYKAY